jgi:mono/diheme cytochrome c family protein
MNIRIAYFFILITALTILIESSANAEPYPNGDPKIGKALVSKNCIQCHADRFGGDGSAIYTRENRLVKTSRGLLVQIRNCNTMLGLKLFEDEELNVASYLNKTYYHFEK